MKHFPHVFVSVLLVVMAGVGARDAFSAQQRHLCQSRADSRVVSLPSFIGDAAYCVNRSLL